MSTPADFYKSLPPVTRAYGTLCILTTVGYHLGLVNPRYLYLDYSQIFRNLQLWRLLTNFLFLGPFSLHFGMQILMIARYGVQLEKGPYDRRTADFLWMLLSTMGALILITLAVPQLNYRFMGGTVVFMLVYLWSREFASSRVNISGLVTLQGFYLPWALLALNTIFGALLWPDLLGILVGHFYYFFNVLHPRTGGRQLLKTPLWVHKLVAQWVQAGPQQHTPAAATPAEGRVFTGRSYRMDRN